MTALIDLLIKCPAIIIATTLHEFSRAAISTLLGDTMPKSQKRLTLNPIRHFEPVGFIFMLVSGFGWGQPVNTSAVNYKNRKRDTLITAVFPLFASFVFALLFSYAYKYLPLITTNYYVARLLSYTISYNIALVVYNLIPIPPMDGAKIFSCIVSPKTYFAFIQYEKIMQIVLLLLVFAGIIQMVFYPVFTFVNIVIRFLTF